MRSQVRGCACSAGSCGRACVHRCVHLRECVRGTEELVVRFSGCLSCPQPLGARPQKASSVKGVQGAGDKQPLCSAAALAEPAGEGVSQRAGSVGSGQAVPCSPEAASETRGAGEGGPHGSWDSRGRSSEAWLPSSRHGRRRRRSPQRPLVPLQLHAQRLELAAQTAEPCPQAVRRGPGEASPVPVPAEAHRRTQGHAARRCRSGQTNSWIFSK